ncbi:TonB-dependent receptor plug [Galbibacter marinus]|uniref:TonB-dependent receptor plug n=1 Tax=Galbibacter marinus TaxID=555500 RepID=K2PSM5_9FLAO|nr:TonB-dependent receptor [Galbibacter marinus]EKF54564.1 TonB-dependent receptor plug [Galbibacter marinus]
MKTNLLNRLLYPLFLLCFSPIVYAQTATLSGTVSCDNTPLPFVNIQLEGTEIGSATDSFGSFTITGISPGEYRIIVSAVGFKTVTQTLTLNSGEHRSLAIELSEEDSHLSEVVITATMKEVSKLESPVPVEVYSAKFFKSNPSASIFDALQNINGVRPQINCNVCNTGDIHINGLEGPYTMVLIDGMPVVSGLATVYGLSGIPQSLIDRVEIVKGPASTLYGSEAVGGLINIITKTPSQTPKLTVDTFGSSWGELNLDISSKIQINKKVQSLLGVNYFRYQNPIDKNGDNFTDVTLQDRISVFNKWHIKRNHNRQFSFAGRYVYEDRWGGEMDWSKEYRGGTEIYGESIYTSRWELFGNYQLPFDEKLLFQFSLNGHNQNSAYGNLSYMADQKIAFGQLTWNKIFNRHDILAGLTYRYTYYDDNTPATASFSDPNFNQPSHTHLPGLFMQDQISFPSNHKILVGLRYDYNSIHGSILTPRLNYKWHSKDQNNIIRLGIGNGYRVANVFTEDHAALTGARSVVFLDDLKPEKSWNANINLVKKLYTDKGTFIQFDASVFYTYFENKIIADYNTDPNKIIYDNLDGYAVSKGISLNTNWVLASGLKVLAGATLMDVYSIEQSKRTPQLFTEKFTAVWNVGYEFSALKLKLDYTGNLYGPMALPLLSDTDPRKENSPWWSIQNLQLTKNIGTGFELYGGVKNLLNWTPWKDSPFIIARSHDPFDKNVEFDSNGKALVTDQNPYGLTFDPSYVYGPNQGIRGFMGIRWRMD